MRAISRLVFPFAILALLAIAGCQYDGTLRAVQCDDHDECESGQCVSGYCVLGEPELDTDLPETNVPDADPPDADSPDTDPPDTDSPDTDTDADAGDTGPALECEGPEECPDPAQSCLDGTCQCDPELPGVCCGPSDCSDDEICEANACVCPTPSCAGVQCGDVENACGETNTCAECPGDLVCDNNQCLGCADDTDCTPGFCVNDECVQCDDDDHCPDGVCVSQTCVECEVDGHCGDDEVCQGNECTCPDPTCEPGACGAITNACGGQEDCGDCSGGLVCEENQCVLCSPSAGPYGGGLGTESAPFRICHWDHWVHLVNTPGNWDAHFLLDAHLQGGLTSPVGDEDTPFTGTFNGQGMTISGVQINVTDADNTRAGLFGVVDGATIENLTLQDPVVTGGGRTGALIGFAQSATVADVHVVTNATMMQANIQGTGNNVGGLIGRINGGSVTRSTAQAVVQGGGDSLGGLIGRSAATVTDSGASGALSSSTSSDRVGGLIGRSQANVSRCRASVNVTTLGNRVGGLIGHNDVGNVRDSYALGNVTGVNQVGGLVGFHERGGAGNNREIARSFAFGLAVGSNNVGGLVGERSGTIVAIIEHSRWNEDSGSNDNGLGTPMPAADFADQSNFPGSWDFDSVWRLEGPMFYPALRWED